MDTKVNDPQDENMIVKNKSAFLQRIPELTTPQPRRIQLSSRDDAERSAGSVSRTCNSRKVSANRFATLLIVCG